ncbi:MAG: hypothetical protein IKK15_02275, partial [Akkermansia sp.]|nr:hypothetical protein [Akkermansia sp.]
MSTAQTRREYLESEMKHRILMLDGAQGTMIQKHCLQERDYRGERFADRTLYPQDLKNNNDFFKGIAMNVIFEEARLAKFLNIIINKTFVVYKIIGSGTF